MSRDAGLDGQVTDDSQERYFRWLFTRLDVPAHGRCLDIGCADPRVLGAFAATGRVPVGFSFDGLNSRTVQQLYPEAELADHDYDEAGEVYARAGDAFDFMFCRGLGFAERLLDWAEPGFVEATRALSQCLTANGVLLWAQYPDRQLGRAEPIVRRRSVQGLLRHLEMAGLRLLSFAPTSTVVTVLAVRPDFPIEREALVHQANARDWLSILRHARVTLDQVPAEDAESAPVDDATVIDALRAASAHLATLYLPRVTDQRLLIAGTDAVARIYARAAEDLGQRVVGFWSSTAGEWTPSGMRHPIGWLPTAPADRPTAIIVADPLMAPAVAIAIAGMTPVVPVLNLWPLAPYVSDVPGSGWRGRPGFVDVRSESRDAIEGAGQGFVAELLAARARVVSEQRRPPIGEMDRKSLSAYPASASTPIIVPLAQEVREPVIVVESMAPSESIAVVEPVVEPEPIAWATPIVAPVTFDLPEPVVVSELEEEDLNAGTDWSDTSLSSDSEQIEDGFAPASIAPLTPRAEELPDAPGLPQVEMDNEPVPLEMDVEPTPDHPAIALSPVEPDEGDVASLLRRTIGCHSIVGDGTVNRRGDTVQMVALSKQSVRIVHGPIDVLRSSQIGFSATILRLSGTETECRVEIMVGGRRGVLVLGPTSVWVTDSAELIAAVEVPEPTGYRARLKALLWTITTGSPPTNPVKSSIPMFGVNTAEWHEYSVRIHAGEVELWLDGVVIQRMAAPTGGSGILTTVPATVEFGLWDATDADSEVWWKDCRMTGDGAPLP